MTHAQKSTVDGIQVLGLCRFSVPSLGAFQTEHDSIEERRAYLYDPKRLALRFAWFENVMLPGIAAQKDPDFRMIVLLGEDLPEPWRGRMMAHIEAVPQLVAEFAPPLHHRKVCATAMAKHVNSDAEAVLQFRLDDDDAVAIDFVRRLRRDFRKARGLFNTHGRLVIDYSRGINLAEQGGVLTPIPRFELFLGVAFAICTRPDDGSYILDFAHHVIWQKIPAVTQSDVFMWIRGAHGTNDSGMPKLVPLIEAEEAELRRVLKKSFRVDLPAFRAALKAYYGEYGGAEG